MGIRHFRIIFGTGPGIINDALAKSKPGEVAVIPRQLLAPGFEWSPKPCSLPWAFGQTLQGSSWHRADSRVIASLNMILHRPWKVVVVLMTVLLLQKHGVLCVFIIILQIFILLNLR